MKKNQILRRLTAIVLTLFVLTGSVFSQAPGKFNYQAVLRNAQGVAKTNYAADIQISILQGNASGSVIFTETHHVTTSAIGMINLEIGSLNPTGFSDISWSNGPYFLKISVDGIEMGTTQLLSVPFALYAQTAESANNAGVTGDETAFSNWDKDVSDDFSGDYDDLSNKPIIPSPVSGTESVFNTWDKNASDDFSGNYNDLTNKPPVTSSQWVTNGSNINYSIGNVGVGITNPTAKLEVNGVIKGISRDGAEQASGQIQSWTNGAAQGLKAVYSFYPTFQNSSDNSPRRTADIVGGFNGGAWGYEYLSFNVGNNSRPNDNQSITNEKMRITGSGNVGIGTTSPSEKLDVVGNVEVSGEYKYAEAKTDYYHVGCSEFSARNADVGKWALHGGQEYGTFAGITGTWRSFATVHLPQGAIVTEVRAYYVDCSSNNLTIYFRRTGSGGISIEDLGSVTSTEADSPGAPVARSMSFNPNATIDNASNRYTIIYESAQNDNNHRLYNVRIRYTIDHR